MHRKILTIVSALALTGAVTGAAGAPATAAPSASRSSAAQLDTTPTRFALTASGYASKVIGGGVPAGSDRSAFQVIGCTNLAGLHKSNVEAEVDLGEFKLSGLRTDVRTTKNGETVTSWGRNRIARVVLADGPDRNLVLEGVRSTSTTLHNGTRFRAFTKTEVASIRLDVPGPVDVNFPVPAPGSSVNIPGVARITVGNSERTVNRNGATAENDAIKIRVFATGTVAFLAHSRATIMDGLKRGIYSGSSYATRVNALSGTVKSGPTPLLIMPCTGTKFVRRSIAFTDLGGLGRASALNASQRGTVRNGNPNAFERGEVGQVRLLGGRLVVKGVVGRANVELVGNKARKSTEGTKVAVVRFNDRVIKLSGNDTVNLGNVARLQPRVVKRTRYGIEVTALRVTLLGRSVEINLGHAKVAIRPSGL